LLSLLLLLLLLLAAFRSLLSGLLLPLLLPFPGLASRLCIACRGRQRLLPSTGRAARHGPLLRLGAHAALPLPLGMPRQ
jgi:hypothetical protein